MTIRKPFYGILMPTLKIDLTSHLESTRSSLPLKRLTLSAAQQLLTNASLLEVFEATVKRMYITALGTKLATARSHWLFGSKIHSFVSCQNQQFPKKMGWCPNFETHPSGCYKLPLFPKVFLVLLLYDWSAGLGLYQYDPCQISKAPATMDINKIPLNRWTWWNMSIACMYTYIYIYASTIISCTKSIFYINLFLWLLGTKGLHLHLHSTNPFGLPLRIHHSLLLCCPQATGSPRKSNWPRGHQQRMPKLPPDPKWRSLNRHVT